MPTDPLEWYLAPFEKSVNSSNCNCHQYCSQHLHQHQLLLPERTFLTISRQNGLVRETASPKSILKTPALGTGKCFYGDVKIHLPTVGDLQNERHRAGAQRKVISLFAITAKDRQVPEAMGNSPEVCLNLLHSRGLPALTSLWPGSPSSVVSAKLWQWSWWQPLEQWQESICKFQRLDWSHKWFL